MRQLLMILILLCSSSAYGQIKTRHVTSHVEIPTPTGYRGNPSPELKNVGWDIFETKNFYIISADYGQGAYLASNIEAMKTWIFNRWGIPDIDFKIPCKISCVPTQDLMEKICGLKGSFGEVRKDDSGKITESLLWVVLDVKPAESIPPALTLICLKEFEQQANVKFGFWAHRGMAQMNATGPQIRERLASLNPYLSKDQKIYFSNYLLTITEKEWATQSDEHRHLFDAEALALCLLLRKEYGQKNFVEFLKSDERESDVQSIFGYQNFNEFDATFKRYMFDLSKDVIDHRTPNSYLQIP